MSSSSTSTSASTSTLASYTPYYSTHSHVNTTNRFPKLASNQVVDIAIIGGGLAGISTAYSLSQNFKSKGLLSYFNNDKKENLKVIVLEEKNIGYGASGRNGGFAMPGYALTERDLVDYVGKEKAKSLLSLTYDALKMVKQRVIEFGGSKTMTHGLMFASWFDDEKGMRDFTSFMKEMHPLTDYKYVPREELRKLFKSNKYYDGVFDPESFEYHSLDYAKEMALRAQAKGVQVCENTSVKEIRINSHQNNYELITSDDRTVIAKNIVYAISGYKYDTVIKNVPLILRSSIVPVQTWVLSTKPLGDKMKSAIVAPYGLIDTRFSFDYYRPLPNTNGEILWGGRCAGFHIPLVWIKKWMVQDILNIYPQLNGVEVASVWNGTMGYTRDRMPLIGQVPGMKNFWYNTGHGGHGIVTTSMGGELIARAIDSNDERYKSFDTFKPTYSFGNYGCLGAQLCISYYEIKDSVNEFLDRFRK